MIGSYFTRRMQLITRVSYETALEPQFGSDIPLVVFEMLGGLSLDDSCGIVKDWEALVALMLIPSIRCYY